MKKSIIAALAIAITAGLWGGSASAGGINTPGVDARQHRQGMRIFNGVANGSLTPGETGRLIAGQARIRAKERRFKSDGVVTRGERIRLHRSQNRQSRRIFRAKHN